MANSAVVGTLRAILSADTAEFATAMKKAGDAADQTAKDMTKASASFEAAGGRMASVTRLIKDFSGSLERRSAEEFALAIEKIGGAARLSENELRRAGAVFSDYISKAKALGQEVPAHIAKLNTEITKLGGATQKGAGFIGDLKGSFSNLGPSIISSAAGFATALISVEGLMAGFRLLTGFVTDSVKAFLSAEVASKKIDAALRTQGQFTPTLARQYKDLASEMESLTVNSDDLNAEAIAVFTSIGDVGPDAMKRALAAAADLSAGMGIDLVSAATRLAKAVDGQEESLKRFGIEVDQTADKGQRLDAVLQGVQKNFGGRAAAEVETTSGQLKQLANSWDNVQEIIGGMIVQSPVFQAFLQTTNALLKQQEAEVNKVTAAYQKYRLEASFRGMKGPAGADVNLPPIQPWIDYTKVLADARKEIAEKLGPAQLAQIEAAKKTGKSLDEVLARYKLTPAAIALVTKETKENTKAVDENEKKYQEWAKTVSGKKLAEEIKTLDTNWARLSKTLKGAELDAAMRAVALETEALRIKGGMLTPALKTLNNEFIGFGKNIFTAGVQLPAFSDALSVSGDEVKELGANFQDINKKFTDFNKLINTSKGFQDLFKGGLSGEQINKDFEDIETGGEKAVAALFAVGNAFQQLGHAIGGTKGQILADIGQIAEGIGRLASGDVIGGLLQITGAVAKHLKTLGRNIARDMQDAFATSELGFANLAALSDELKRLGAVDLVNRGDRAQRKDDEKETRKWMEDVKKFLAESDKSAAALASRLASAFDELSGSVVDFGGKAPKALQPLIDQLLKATNLTEEQRLILQGLAGAPEWKQLQQIAEKYGIELSSLGQQFQESRIGDIAMQYARDFMTLRDAGGDVNGILAGMQDEVQALVLESLKFGVALPEALRDVVQGLVDMGQLTDENGEALTDLSRINFKGTLEDAFLDIKSILEDIRDLLAGGLPKAAEEGASRIKLPFEGMRIKIPIDFEPSAFAAPEGFGLTPLQHGGIVRRPTAALIGEAGPEAVVPLEQLSGADRYAIYLDNYLDGRKITETVLVHTREVARRIGVRPI